MDMRRLVGRNFARIRRENGLTQEQVEELSGFSQQYLSGLEQGLRLRILVWTLISTVTTFQPHSAPRSWPEGKWRCKYCQQCEKAHHTGEERTG